MENNLKDLKSMTYDEIEEFVISLGEKRYRAQQIYKFIVNGINDFSEMNNIPKSLREKLSLVSELKKVNIYKKLESKIDGTLKYLMELNDKNIVETVLMRYKHGNTICISTQVGCRMGCTFCASTIGGLVRNLTAGEMIGQIIAVQNDIGERISNIVLMGAGEPFDNFENLKRFLVLVHDEKGINIGYRNITISTCGIVPKIYELAELNIPVNLAISLHQSNQDDRKRIMPIANKYNIKELIDAAKFYSKKTKRRITYEYALIDGVNNDDKTAYNLINLLKNTPLSHVNIIPVNSVDENSFKRPSEKSIKRFLDLLSKNNIQATVRRELGSDISGACGQLRRSVIEEV